MTTAQQLQSARLAADLTRDEHTITGNATDGYRVRPIQPLNRGCGYPSGPHATRDVAEQALRSYLDADCG